MNRDTLISTLRSGSNTAILSDRTFAEVADAAMPMYAQCDEKTVTDFLIKLLNSVAGQVRYDVSSELRRAADKQKQHNN